MGETCNESCSLITFDETLSGNYWKTSNWLKTFSFTTAPFEQPSICLFYHLHKIALLSPHLQTKWPIVQCPSILPFFCLSPHCSHTCPIIPPVPLPLAFTLPLSPDVPPLSFFSLSSSCLLMTPDIRAPISPSHHDIH